MALGIVSMLVTDNSLRYPRSIEELQTELRSPGTQLRAMRTVVSMLQQNYDMGILCSDVLKVMDTTSPELKILCNVYLRSTCIDRPACQLMCTHTFLKDFNDRNWILQRLAASDAVQLADEVIVKSYGNSIRRICVHEKKEIRMAAARCMSLFYLKNRDTFFHEDLDICLKNLLCDSEGDVAIAAATSISVIESKESFVSEEEVYRAMDTFVEKRNCQGVRAVLGICRHKKLTDKARNTMVKLLHCGDICVFYLSSKKLLEHDQSLYQEVYDIAMGFMECRAEQLYNLLVYMDSFFDKVVSNSSDFVILNNDPDYIKDMKIRLLMQKYDRTAESEIKRLVRRRERVIKILECALKFNVVVNDIFMHISPDHHDRSLEIIYEYYTRARESTSLDGSLWNEMIGEYLKSITHEIRETHLYITLCGVFCRSISPLIRRLKNESNSAHMMRFYCLMMCRGVIDQHQCQRYLRSLGMVVPHMPRIKLLIKHINKINAEDIYKGLAMQGKDTDPLASRICNANKNGWHCTAHKSQSHGIREQAQSMGQIHTRKGRTAVESMPVYIDDKMFKGTLDILDSKIILNFDILEENQSIKCALHTMSGDRLRSGTSEHSDTLEWYFEASNEGRYTLFTIEDIHLGSIFGVEIGSEGFDVRIDVHKLAKPLQCDPGTFEQCFLHGEEIVLEMANKSSFELHDGCYAFQIFGHKIFGKRLNNNLIALKGDPEILEKLKKGI